MRPRGRPTRRAGLALALALVATSAAADIYKIVGADGRVTYSDRPPVGTEGVRSAIVAHTGASTPTVSVGPADGPDPGGAVARPATVASGAAGDDAHPPLPPALSEALVSVLAGQDLVQAMFDNCTRARPETYSRFADHLRTWRRHNVQIVTQADRILSIGLPAPGRAALQSAAQSRTQTSVEPILHGPRPRLLQWCDEGVGQLVDGTLDMAARPDIAEPISRWVAP